jgi:hypothetical protein
MKGNHMTEPPVHDTTDTETRWAWGLWSVAVLLGVGAFGTYLVLGPGNPIPAFLLILALPLAITSVVIGVVPSDEEAGL